MAETKKRRTRRAHATEPEAPTRRLTERLKAERIQGAAPKPRIEERPKAERIQDRLKAERIQGLLAELPGWRVAEDGAALERTHRFPTARAAAAFVAFTTELGEAVGYLPELDLRREEVTLRIAADPSPGLTRRDFDLARRFSAFGESGG